MANYQMQGGAAMQGMTAAQLATLQGQQIAAVQSGQLTKANSAQLQQQLVPGVAPGSMAMPAASAPAAAVPGMAAGKMATPVRPANMQPMVAGAMPHAGVCKHRGCIYCNMHVQAWRIQYSMHAKSWVLELGVLSLSDSGQ